MGRRTTDNSMPQDHDILIEIRTELGFVRTEVKDIKDNFAGKIKDLEDTKTGLDVSNDHEKRLRRLEFWGTVAYGLLIALQTYFQYFKR